MVPLTAITEPLPKALPPDAVTELSAVARMTAVSSAVMVRVSATAVALRRNAATLLRTSFSTTSPPRPIASESEIL